MRLPEQTDIHNSLVTHADQVGEIDDGSLSYERMAVGGVSQALRIGFTSGGAPREYIMRAPLEPYEDNTLVNY